MASTNKQIQVMIKFHKWSNGKKEVTGGIDGTFRKFLALQCGQWPTSTNSAVVNQFLHHWKQAIETAALDHARESGFEPFAISILYNTVWERTRVIRDMVNPRPAVRHKSGATAQGRKLMKQEVALDPRTKVTQHKLLSDMHRNNRVRVANDNTAVI